MSRVPAESFLQIDEADLSAYADARAAELDLVIAAPFRPSVLENLTALQRHARRVSAALQERDAAPAEAHKI
jgi:hypothetical protein